MVHSRIAPHTLVRSLIICAISTFSNVSISQGQAAPPLSAYNVDPSTVTVAGIGVVPRNVEKGGAALLALSL